MRDDDILFIKVSLSRWLNETKGAKKAPGHVDRTGRRGFVGEGMEFPQMTQFYFPQRNASEYEIAENMAIKNKEIKKYFSTVETAISFC